MRFAPRAMRRGIKVLATGLSAQDVDRLEGGGTVPTLPLLRTLAKALDAILDVSIDAEETRVSFVPHAA
ncbi:hypothetical protein ACIQPP_03875 [Streptomyces violaceusniger]|uniref:hypothetical protein n=1 Tax=Streptomyces violaceusniger TaxID=68280 RepID=UPI0009973A9C|nr:hypothetical protein [Streptomyces hygroscopicus]